MKKIIVTTTINSPTKALQKFASMNDWELVVVGDMKTPHEAYEPIRCVYLTPEEQQKRYPKLSEAIGWNCIQRRNIGFIYAFDHGADVIATVDDDNIPYRTWGDNIEQIFSEGATTRIYESSTTVADPFSVTTYPNLWHRGFPIEMISQRSVEHVCDKQITPSIYAELWDGDPDVDAICRIALSPDVKFGIDFKFSFANSVAPFNSQNTWISRETLKDYFMFPFVGRMDDIWGAYWYQELNQQNPMFGPASVYQERNAHNLRLDLVGETMGYSNAFCPVENKVSSFIPRESMVAYEIYRSYFE